MRYNARAQIASFVPRAAFVRRGVRSRRSSAPPRRAARHRETLHRTAALRVPLNVQYLHVNGFTSVSDMFIDGVSTLDS